MRKETILGCVIAGLLVAIVALLFWKSGNPDDGTAGLTTQREAPSDSTVPPSLKPPSADPQSLVKDAQSVLQEFAKQVDPSTPPSLSKDSLPNIKPREMVADAFKFGQEIIKSGDSLGQSVWKLDVKEEKEWGEKLHQELSHSMTILRAGAELERIQRLAEPLLKQRKRTQINYTFSIVDDPELNAFSILGGYIYVNKGLLDFVKADSELQFVLGHEIGHVELRHCVEKFTYAARATELGTEVAGGVVSRVYDLMQRGYSEEHEFEADGWSWKSMKQIGKTRDEALTFLKHLHDHSATDAESESESERPATIFGVAARELENHYRSHPPDAERIRRLDSLPIASERPAPAK